VIEFAKKHPDEIEVGFARPGIITSNADMGRTIASFLVKTAGFIKTISREDIAAVMLNEVMKGFSKGIEPLDNDDLQQAAADLKKSSMPS
jgi:hypothetical protein